MQAEKIKTANNAAESTFEVDFTTMTVSTQERIKMAEGFLNSLILPVTKKFSYLWIQSEDKQTKRTIAFSANDNFEHIAQQAIELNDEGNNVFVGVNLTDKPMGEHERPHEKDITLQTAIIADIDCQSAWHVGEKYPATFEQAKSFLPFEPSILVNSGAGLHSYLLLKNPLQLTSDEERNQTVSRNKDYIEMIRQKAGVFTSAVDGVHDLPRILRLPGTYNLKGGKENAPLCKVVSFGNNYTLENLRELIKPKIIIPAENSPLEPSTGYTPTYNTNSKNSFDDSPEYNHYRALKMLEKIPCSQQTYSDWVSVGMILKTNGNTCTDWINWSSQDERFKFGECESKWADFEDKGLTIATLHGLAKRFGYVEKDFWHEWHKEKIYTKWLIDNKISDVVKSKRKYFNDFTNSDTFILSARVGQVNERTDIFMSTDTTVTKATKMDLFTLKEAANYIGVNEKTLRRWNQEKIFEPYLIDHHGDFFYTREELEKLKSVYTKSRNKTYSNVRTMSAGQNVKYPKDSSKLTKEEKFELFKYPQTDLGNADRLKTYCGQNIRFLTDSCRWLTYQKNIWQDGGRDNSAILPYALKLSQIISNNTDEDNETEKKLSRQWQMKKTYGNSIEVLKGFDSIRITEQDLNTHKNLLCCQNGVVDLQTGKLYQHDSKYLMTQMINAEYRADYRNDRVNKFLHEVLPDEETLQALLRFLGYCLTGETREHKALFIHGEGGNGKSVTTKTLLTLFNDYGCSFPIESILTQPRIKDADSATPAFAKLQWRRLSISEEIPAGRKLDYAKFKILTGGDALPIRKLFQEATEIKNPTHKMIFSGNHLPELDDTHDAGILRRWLQIKFEQDFTKNPDTTLQNFLQTKDAMAALLNILVENAMAWHKDGLIISEKMNQDREKYFAENDFVTEFISEFCERGGMLSVSRKDLLSELRTEYPSETKGKSDRELTSLTAKIDGITYKRGGKDGGNKFFGIALRDGYKQENLSDDFLPPNIE